VRRREADRFPRARGLRKGYHRKQVDAFLARVELAVHAAAPSVSAGEVRQAGFVLVRRGYDIRAVDTTLDSIEEQVIVLNAVASRRGKVDPGAETAFLRRELTAPYMQRFPRGRFLSRGYDIDEVDEFIDRVCASIDAQADEPDPSLEEVRKVAFRSRRGGYAEDAVDDTLDRIVELMLLVRIGPVSPPAR
jgi:DivIVA domain-containing protein